MSGNRTLVERISGRNGLEKAILALSVLFAAFLVIDPLVFTAMRGLDPDLRRFFRVITDIGKSNWILISAGAGILVLAWLRAREMNLRKAAVYGYGAQLLMFLFATVAVTGVASSLLKNVIGRARPKFFNELGPIEFRPFTFDYDFASFPSGHATTAGALAGVLAIVWPRASLPLFAAAAWVAASRVFIGAHFFTDAVAGCVFGAAAAYIMRDRLAARGWLFRRDGIGNVRLRGRPLLDRAENAVMARVESLASKLLNRPLIDRGQHR